MTISHIRSHNPKVVSSNLTPATIYEAQAKGVAHQEQPPFSEKLERFCNPKVVNGLSPPILLICKGFASHVGKAFLLLGQIWDRNQFFLCDIQVNPSQQFTQLPCRIALTLSQSMPARGMKLAKANENKFRCEVLQLCYRHLNRCRVVWSPKKLGWSNDNECHQAVWA